MRVLREYGTHRHTDHCYKVCRVPADRSSTASTRRIGKRLPAALSPSESAQHALETRRTSLKCRAQLQAGSSPTAVHATPRLATMLRRARCGPRAGFAAPPALCTIGSPAARAIVSFAGEAKVQRLRLRLLCHGRGFEVCRKRAPARPSGKMLSPSRALWLVPAAAAECAYDEDGGREQEPWQREVGDHHR